MRVKNIIPSLSAVAIMIATCSVMMVSSAQNDRNRSYYVYDYETRTVVDSYILLHANIASSPATAGVDPDDDVRVPYSNSGIVRLENGTGFIVGDNVIATCAHCIYETDDNHYINMTVSLYDDEGNFVKTIVPVEAHLPQAFVASEDGQTNHSIYDYALLVVDEDLSDYGRFQLGVPMDTLDGVPLTVSGYPSYVGGTGVWGRLYTHTGSIVHTTYNAHLIKYNTQTSGGQSGSPAYVTTSYQLGNQTPVQTRTAIAIHTADFGEYNGGVKITSELLNFYLNNPSLN